MKEILTCFALLLNLNVCNASFGIHKKEASTEQASINPDLHPDVQVEDYINERRIGEKGQEKNFKEKDEQVRMKKTFLDRIIFKLVKNGLAKKIGIAGTDTKRFNLGGFLLGLFLPLIGPLAAYIFSANENFIKWAWIGTATYVLVGLVAFFISIGSWH